ncbi:MAG: asparagine synthase-related protein [Acidobacteriota bacterium]
MAIEERYVARVVNLIPDHDQRLFGGDLDTARRFLVAGDQRAFGELGGSFAIMARDGERVLMARSLDRPMRYFLAKEASGPMLVVADRIDAIHEQLEADGYGDQFHPSYTRMVPAHHVTELQLVGCPDPNPGQLRFFDPPHATLPTDLDLIGERYVGALASVVRTWLDTVDDREPIGVPFSGGLDSGTVLLTLYHQLLATGRSPSRLKAFTLAVDGGGEDLAQARAFLRATNLEMLHEPIEVAADAVDPLAAVELIEDYKPRDVECAAMMIALCRALRERYADWRLLVDGDGGDENLKDYPIEENPELTIRSVVNNRMLYQEGWGVDAIKHSLTYSGGLSRGCVRGWAPSRHHGFIPFSPMTQTPVIAVAEAIPFADLSAGSHEALYGLKGEVYRRGVAKVLGIELPVFAKRRFQHGAAPAGLVAERFDDPIGHGYRRHFLRRYQS